MPEQSEKAENRYKAIIERIFFDRYTKGATEIVWDRTEIESAADRLGIALPNMVDMGAFASPVRTKIAVDPFHPLISSFVHKPAPFPGIPARRQAW